MNIWFAQRRPRLWRAGGWRCFFGTFWYLLTHDAGEGTEVKSFGLGTWFVLLLQGCLTLAIFGGEVANVSLLGKGQGHFGLPFAYSSTGCTAPRLNVLLCTCDFFHLFCNLARRAAAKLKASESQSNTSKTWRETSDNLYSFKMF